MTNDEEVAAWKHIAELLDKASPFKRVRVPQHLIDRYNQEKGTAMTEFAVTVKKDVEVTDELMWEAMNFVATDLSEREHNPPRTGMDKTTLFRD